MPTQSFTVTKESCRQFDFSGLQADVEWYGVLAQMRRHILASRRTTTMRNSIGKELIAAITIQLSERRRMKWWQRRSDSDGVTILGSLGEEMKQTSMAAPRSIQFTL